MWRTSSDYQAFLWGFGRAAGGRQQGSCFLFEQGIFRWCPPALPSKEVVNNHSLSLRHSGLSSLFSCSHLVLIVVWIHGSCTFIHDILKVAFKKKIKDISISKVHSLSMFVIVSYRFPNIHDRDMLGKHHIGTLEWKGEGHCAWSSVICRHASHFIPFNVDTYFYFRTRQYFHPPTALIWRLFAEYYFFH